MNSVYQRLTFSRLMGNSCITGTSRSTGSFWRSWNSRSSGAKRSSKPIATSKRGKSATCRWTLSFCGLSSGSCTISSSLNVRSSSHQNIKRNECIRHSLVHFITSVASFSSSARFGWRLFRWCCCYFQTAFPIVVTSRIGLNFVSLSHGFRAVETLRTRSHRLRRLQPSAHANGARHQLHHE